MYRINRVPKVVKGVTTWKQWGRLKRTHKLKTFVPVERGIADMDLAVEAFNHTIYMSKNWKYLTKDSMFRSFYRVKHRDKKGNSAKRKFMDKIMQVHDKGIKYPKVIMLQSGLLDAALEVDDGRNLCIVSPSYHNYKCSGYYQGWKNVEADLCRESNLYNISSTRPFYTRWVNNRMRRRQKCGAYIDSLFYMKKVLFERDDILRRYDVILCWPPKSVSFYQQGISVSETRLLLETRLRYILNVAEEQNISTIVFNDWGCDDFLLNNPVTVANALRQALKDIQIERVVLAISNKENYRIFKYIFEKRE